MATAVQQFHEEEAIDKTYDRAHSRRLLRYLRPYRRLIIPALLLTLLANGLGVIQPKFFQWAIDWYIVPGNLSGLGLIAIAFLAVKVLQLFVSYLQTVFLQSVGQHVMYDLRSELYRKLQRQEVALLRPQPRRPRDDAH